MIPKKIHYCWFGRGKKTKLARKCIESWKKYCPDYEIVEWNEDNFDVNINAYVKEAYQAKKYAFVSDYARFYILYHEGGVYFDTDVELIKPIDEIVAKGAFMGCETDGCNSLQEIYEPNKFGEVNPGLGIAAAPGLGIAAAPGLRLYEEILEYYNGIHFLMPDGSLNQKTVVAYTTEVLLANGLKDTNEIQQVGGVWIYPKEYFCPMDNSTGKLVITEKTVSIHWYSKSWVGTKQKIISKIARPFHRIFGDDCFRWLKKGK